jgi:hypothetical protein
MPYFHPYLDYLKRLNGFGILIFIPPISGSVSGVIPIISFIYTENQFYYFTSAKIIASFNNFEGK